MKRSQPRTWASGRAQVVEAAEALLDRVVEAIEALLGSQEGDVGRAVLGIRAD
jgi:hypothetical protein